MKCRYNKGEFIIKLTPMKKQFLIISASVVLAAGLALSGFGCQQPAPSVNNEIGTSVTTVTSTPIPTPTATATPAVTATPVPTGTPEISGTGYTNQTYGYNFVYGTGWHLSQYNTPESISVVNFTEGDGSELAGSEAKIEVSVVPNTGKQTLETFIESQLNYDTTGINRREMELVGNEKAFWVEAQTELGTTQTYYLEHGANFFLISLYVLSPSAASQQAYDLVVSSFTFVR